MSYEMIDRFLRNSLDDDTYAEYSAALGSACAPPDVRFEFTDKGKAEVVVCPMGLAYGVQCVGFPHVFAQFLFQSDAEQFVKIFNGTLSPMVDSSISGGGGGFESRPVPPTSKGYGV